MTALVLATLILARPNVALQQPGDSAASALGYQIALQDPDQRSVPVGTDFTAHLTNGGKTLYSLAWESLTPDTCQLVNSQAGIFRPLRAGNAVLRATVLTGTRGPKEAPVPIFVAVTSVITIKPLLLLAASPIPGTLFVQETASATAIAFRDSSLADNAKNASAIRLKRSGVAQYRSRFIVRDKEAVLRSIEADLQKLSEPVSDLLLGDLTSLSSMDDALVRATVDNDLDLKDALTRAPLADKAQVEKILNEITTPAAGALPQPGTQDPWSDLSPLLDELPIKVTTLTPDLLNLSSAADESATTLSVDNASSFTLRALKPGTARLQVECGGSVRQYAIPIVQPDVSVTCSAPIVSDSGRIQATVKLIDHATQRPIDSSRLEITDTLGTSSMPLDLPPMDPDSFTRTATVNRTEALAAGSKDLGGTHTFTATLKGTGGGDLAKGSAVVTVRHAATSVALQKKTLEIIQGDTVTIPVIVSDGSGKAITTLEDGAIKATVDPVNGTITTPDPHLTASVATDAKGTGISVNGNMAGYGYVTVTCDGQPFKLGVNVLPQLEISSARVSDRTARDLFGAQMAKEYIIRQLTFINRLGDVVSNTDIKGKDEVVYANTLFNRVIVAQGPYTDADLSLAITRLQDVLQFRALDPQKFREFLHAYEEYTRSFLSGTVHVAVLPYSPVLFGDLSKMKDAIDARRSEDVFERIFNRVNYVTSFLGGFSNLRDIGILTALQFPKEDNPRNPFYGDNAAKTRDAFTNLFTALTSIDKQVRDKQGKAFSSDSILDGTLTIPVGTPVQRYLFVPRDSMERYGRISHARIIDLYDDDFQIRYKIVQDPTGVASGKPASAPVLGSGGA